MFLVEQQSVNGKTNILIFGRDKTGKKYVETVKDFLPYFYVDNDTVVPHHHNILKVETGFKNLFGNPVKKVIVQNPKDVVELRNKFGVTYESDIRFTNRFIIDRYGEAEIYNLHILAIDIETDTLGKFPDVDKANQPIISIACYDNRGHKKVFFLTSPEMATPPQSTDNVATFSSENNLLSSFVSYVRRLDPDVLTHWNGDGFDMPYLEHRMHNLNVDASRLSPLLFFKTDVSRNDVTIKGRVNIDMLKAYRYFRRITNQGQATSYTLENVAQDVLGIGKIPHQDNFHKLWITNPNKMIEYNLRDAELVIKINNKLDIINFFNYLRSKAYSQLSDIFFTSRLVDNCLLHMCNNDVVLPAKNKTKDKKVPGAYVFPPKPGIHKNVIVLDLKSLYPSIIKTFNVSLETFNPEGEIKLRDGIGFDKKPGILPKLLRSLQNERSHFKTLMHKAKTKEDQQLYNYKQYAVKTIMNSAYGYTLFPTSRMYKREVGGSIPAWGQEIIKFTADYLRNKGYEVVAGDTDSVMFKSKSDNLLGILKEGTILTNQLNKEYKTFVKKYGDVESELEIEFEKVFEKVLYVCRKNDITKGAKKNYAYKILWEDGQLGDGTIKVKGMSSRRSDTPKIAKEVQKKVINMIMNEKNKETIVEYLRDIDKQIRTGKIPSEDIAFPKGISNELSEYGKTITNEKTGTTYQTGTPPVIRGAKYANKYLNQQFGKGDKPKWLYIKQSPPHFPDTDVLTFQNEFPEGFIVDLEKMRDKLFRDKLEPLFISAGFGAMPIINSAVKTLNEYR